MLTALILDTVRMLQMFAFRVTDEDQAVFWLAAQEFRHFHFREPAFYGQDYYTLFESLPAAVLVSAGMSPETAVPVALEAMGLGAWLVLSIVAWRRGSHAVSLLALALPVLLTVPYGMMLSQPFHAGLFFACAGIASMHGRRPWTGLPAGLLIALAGVLNLNSLLLSLPALVWTLVTRRRDLLYAGSLGLGLLLGAGVRELSIEFYRLHPNWVIHPSVQVEWSPTLLVEAVRHLDRHFRYFSPIFVPLPGLALPALASAAVVLGLMRRWAATAVAVLGLALTLAALGVPKTAEGSDGVHFSLQRSFLALPLLAVFVLMLAGRPNRQGSGWPVVMLLIVFLPTFGYRELVLQEQIRQYQVAPQPDFTGVRTVAAQESRCAAIDRFARATRTELVVFTRDRGSAYACAALDYDRLQTLVPDYERRTWRLKEERSVKRSSLIVADVTPDFCSRADVRQLATCSYDSDSRAALLSLHQRQSSLQVVRTLGYPIRAF